MPSYVRAFEVPVLLLQLVVADVKCVAPYGVVDSTVLVELIQHLVVCLVDVVQVLVIVRELLLVEVSERRERLMTHVSHLLGVHGVLVGVNILRVLSSNHGLVLHA